mmetsp:Transcript_13407/g.58551  ORF Transcript_13407/g.58551 Transcript_13407/m.58551 type:complete len:202 (+) Transcript_13407:224-829(+)
MRLSLSSLVTSPWTSSPMMSARSNSSSTSSSNTSSGSSPPGTSFGISWIICVRCFADRTSSRNPAMRSALNVARYVANLFFLMLTTETAGTSSAVTSNAAANDRCSTGSTTTNLTGLSDLSSAAAWTIAVRSSVSSVPCGTKATTQSPAPPHSASSPLGVPTNFTGSAAPFFLGPPSPPAPRGSFPSTCTRSWSSHECMYR